MCSNLCSSMLYFFGDDSYLLKHVLFLHPAALVMATTPFSLVMTVCRCSNMCFQILFLSCKILFWWYLFKQVSFVQLFFGDVSVESILFNCNRFLLAPRCAFLFCDVSPFFISSSPPVCFLADSFFSEPPIFGRIGDPDIFSEPRQHRYKAPDFWKRPTGSP